MKKTLSVVAGGLVIAAGAYTFTAETSATCTPYIHHLNVNQGDATLIQCGTTDILIDAANRTIVHEKLAQHVKDGIIELLVITHKDSDHIAQAYKVFENYKIEEVWRNGKEHEPTRAIEWMIDAIRNEEGIKEVIPTSGYTKMFKQGFELKVCNDAREDPDFNQSSLVTLFTHPQISALLMGDAEIPTFDEVIENCAQSVDILKVGHHGSAVSLNQQLLDTFMPNIATISAGEGNKYGHPRPEPLELLQTKNIPLLRTDVHGDVSCTVNKKEVYCVTEKGGEEE